MSEYKWIKVSCPSATELFGSLVTEVYIEDEKSDWNPEWIAHKSIDLRDLSGMRIKLDLSNGKSVVFWNSEWGGINEKG